MPITSLLLLLAAGAIWFFTSPKRLSDIIFSIVLVVAPLFIIINAKGVMAIEFVLGGGVLSFVLLFRGWKALRNRGKTVKKNDPKLIQARADIARWKESDKTRYDSAFALAIKQLKNPDVTDDELAAWLVKDRAKKKPVK